MSNKEQIIIFENWFTIALPETWDYTTEDDLITICKSYNGNGVIQISCFYRTDRNESLQDTAEFHLNRFINQFNVVIEDNSYEIIEVPGYTIANASGICEDDFIKVWVIVNEEKMLLVTYISSKKTKELSIAEDIIYSIQFISKS